MLCRFFTGLNQNDIMKQIVLAAVLFSFAFTTFSQDNPRPTRSRFWKSKMSTFVVKAGDILVYNVQENRDNYELLVQVKKFGPGLSFHYDIPTKSMGSAVSFDAAAMNTGTSYSVDGTTAEPTKRTFWLSKKNYSDLASVGITSMNFGSGVQEYKRGNTSSAKINYKGKEKTITVFNIAPADGENPVFSVLTDQNNPLIVSLEKGAKMTLREVR